MKKQITITMQAESKLQLPAHLQKGEALIDVKNEGFTPLQAMQVVSGVLNGMICDFINAANQQAKIIQEQTGQIRIPDAK